MAGLPNQMELMKMKMNFHYKLHMLQRVDLWLIPIIIEVVA